MTFHDCIQPYSSRSQKSAVSGLRQKLSRQKETDLPGGSQLWLAAVKSGLGVAAVTFILSLILGSFSASLHKRITSAEDKIAEVSTNNVALLAERAMLVKQFRKPAKDADSIAMQESSENHVIKINKKIH